MDDSRDKAADVPPEERNRRLKRDNQDTGDSLNRRNLGDREPQRDAWQGFDPESPPGKPSDGVKKDQTT